MVLNPIEKITFKFKNAPKQTVPTFEVGEFSGFADAANFKHDGLGPKAFNRADFQVSAPSFSAPVIAHCEGGDSKLGITWMRQDLTYNCSFSGGAPADAALTLAFASGSEQQRPPLRAGELRWNGMSIRFDTKQAGADPISGGKPLGYVFSRNSAEIGGLDLGGGLLPPSVFLPPKGATDRVAMMVAALSLVYFQDPGGQ